MSRDESAPLRPDAAELHARLELKLVPGIGDVRITEALALYGSAEAALAALCSRYPALSIRRHSPEARELFDRTLRFLDANPDVAVFAFAGPGYPEGLYHLHDPPPLLFAQGDTQLLDQVAVAIVGTRAATDYGMEAARMLAAGLANAGMVVISGLAHGIDRAAHEATLDAGGATVAVIGSGLASAYPRRHARLQKIIAERGLVISEFLPDEPALSHHFPKRNRIIAALARGVCVVEAPRRSGALITVEHALDLGKDVFAVPGPVGRRTSEGTNDLLRDGAHFVVEAADVLRELGQADPEAAARRAAALKQKREESAARRSIAVLEPEPPPPGPGRELWITLSAEPEHVDRLAARAGMPIGEALAALLNLEVEGYVVQSSGLLFRRAS